jgi:hypothetical protein
MPLFEPDRVTIRKNTGVNVGTRPRLNLIEGTSVTLTVTDDAASDEVDITIASSAGGLAPDDENLILHMQTFA